MHEKRILCFDNSGAIGDAMLKLPFLSMIRSNYPDADLLWYSPSFSVFSGVLSSVATSMGISDVITRPVFNPNVNRASLKDLFSALFFNNCDVLGKGFDIVFDTQTHVKTTLLLKKIPTRIFMSSTANFLFSTIKPPRNNRKKHEHLAYRCLDLVKLVCENPLEPERVILDVGTDRKALADVCLPTGPVYIGFAPGCGHPTRPKKWSVEKYIELANYQLTKNRIPVFFLGPNETDLFGVLSSSVQGAYFPEQDDRVIASGLSGPMMVIALARKLTAAVSNDCGTGHLLAAGDVSLVSLFMSDFHSIKFKPLSSCVRTISAEKFGSNDVSVIPVKTVISSLEEIL